VTRHLRRLTITTATLLAALTVIAQPAQAAAKPPATTQPATTQPTATQPATTQPTATLQAATSRAMWVWSDRPAEQVVSWAAGHGVTELLVYVHPTLVPGELDRLRDLKKRSDAAGIRLSALGGDPSWTFRHSDALAWQRTVVGTRLFAGLHVDIEPYLRREWTTDRTRTAKSYVDVLAKLRAGSTLPLEAAVPFWYGTITYNGRNLATEVLSRVSAVAVMSYRDTVTGPNSVMAISQDWLARGAAAGRPVRLGLETMPLADCAHCTFAEEGAAALNAALDEVTAAGAAYPAFAGTAVHHLDSWLALAQ
jgi:hypothetical protein